MAKVPNLKPDDLIARDMRDALESRGGITHWSYDSMSRIIADTVSTEISRVNAEDTRAFQSLQLSEASGDDLDYLGQEWASMSRMSAAYSSTRKRDKNLYFYVQNTSYTSAVTGVFGDIDSNVVTIPAGTRIRSTEEDTRDSLIYVLDSDVTLNPGSSIAYAGATALTMGAAMNCAANTLTYHDFSDYEKASYNSLRVSNRYPILNGGDREKDTAYRFRIVSYIPSIVQYNKEKIKLLGLSIPGVEEIRILQGHFGIGSAAVIIFGAESETTPALTKKFQEALMECQGPGLEIIAIPGVKVYFDFDLRVLTTRDLSPSEETSLTRVIKNIIADELVGYAHSTRLPIAKIAAAVANGHPSIAGLISRSDSPSLSPRAGFENVYIRKAWADENMVLGRRRLLKRTYVLNKDETPCLGKVDIRYTSKN